MKWLLTTICLFATNSIQANTPLANLFAKIDHESIGVRSVNTYYGAEEAMNRAILRATREYLGLDLANKHFNSVTVVAESCLPHISIPYSRVAYDTMTSLQQWIVSDPYRTKQFFYYFAKFYHAGGLGKTEKERDNNNEEYGKIIYKIKQFYMKELQTKGIPNPINWTVDERRIYVMNILYGIHPVFLKSVRKFENGREGNEFGHESAVNYQIYGNPCLPEGCEQYAKASRAFYVSFQRWAFKDLWWLREFLVWYADQRLHIPKDKQREFAKLVVKIRREELELIRVRKKLGGYDPIRFVGDPERMIK